MNKQQFTDILYRPHHIADLQGKLLDDFLRLAIRAHMHGYVAFNIDEDTLTKLPPPVKMHLRSIRQFCVAQNIQTLAATQLINQQLKAVDIPVLLLKGAAYTLSKKHNAKGRLISDIDILVEKQHIRRVEKCLIESGWKAKVLDDYDEKYYREWSHELPPFVHLKTGVTLDIHHNLLPSTAQKSISIEGIFADKIAIDNNLYVPSDAHMILHSSVHLLLNDDIEKGLRDCFDLYALITDYCKTHSLDELYQLFKEANCHAEFNVLMHLLSRVFYHENTRYIEFLTNHEGVRKKSFTALAMYAGIFPQSSYLDNSGSMVQRYFTYINGHLSKMPPLMFAKHILYKVYRSGVKRAFGGQFFRK